MQITASMYAIVLPMVFLAAVVDSISGGGGLISLPAYTMAQDRTMPSSFFMFISLH